REDAGWLAAAVELAVRNVHEGGGPFGAVIVRDGEQIGTGQNRVTRDNSTWHTPVETVPVPDATSPFDAWLARAERVAY
ncbi:MAG TPA: hypothetical protein VFY38_05230, partial [Pseudonocardia sp.]|nr:hypothetical protein [Pseudonocardia sp.]